MPEQREGFRKKLDGILCSILYFFFLFLTLYCDKFNRKIVVRLRVIYFVSIKSRVLHSAQQIYIPNNTKVFLQVLIIKVEFDLKLLLTS